MIIISDDIQRNSKIQTKDKLMNFPQAIKMYF